MADSTPTPAATASTGPAPATIASASAAAAASLLADLKGAGATDSQALQDFISEYSPISAQWALNLANAKLTNNTADIAKYTSDLGEIAALAAVEAATEAIQLETAVDQTIQTFLQVALNVAAKAAVASLVSL